jgi:hypothetical protein
MKDERTTQITTILAVVLFILGAGVRLYDLTDEPLETHPARQFRAAIIARAIYYESNPDIPAEENTFAQRERAQSGLIEPSILEWLMAQTYRLTGQENIWVGRIFTISFWLLGGIGVYRLAAGVGSPMGALLALSYYLFLPFGVRLSRTLMPDPIMIGLSVLALWALYTWQNRRETSSAAAWAVAAGLLTGAAIFVKTVAGIILIVPFALYILSSLPIKKALSNKHLWLILILAALPTAAYYIWGIFIDGRLATQFGGRFFPQLWTNIVVYKSWGLRIIMEFSLKAFLVGLAGILLASKNNERLLLFGWWAGYFIYGMLFIYYTWTHDYYHLPMVPLVAVSMSPAVAALEDYTKKNVRVLRWVQIMLGVAVAYITISGAIQSVSFMNETDYRQTRQQIKELGAYLASLPEERVIALTADYETSYRFYTFQRAGHWPASGEQNFKQLQGKPTDQFEQLWQEMAEEAGYFLVTDFKELNRQPNLSERLEEYPILKQTELYTLYDLEP